MANNEENAAQYIDIDELIPHPDNPRINDHAVEEVAGSIKRFGFAAPIIARREDNTVIAGHTRLKAAKKLGLSKVPVRFMDLDPVDAKLLMLADNKIGERADWNDDALQAIFEELQDEDLSGLGWDEEELSGILGDLYSEDEEEAQEYSESDDLEPRVKKGDLWKLGDHYLLCGDSTEDRDVDYLIGESRVDMIFTDPPYALFGNSTGVSGIVDDKMVMPFFKNIFSKFKSYSKEYAHIYVFCDWHSCNAIHSAAIYQNLPAKNLIVWDKGDGGVGGMFQNCHELIWFFNNVPKSKYTHTSSGRTTGARVVNGVPNIWRFPRVGQKERSHNAQKPIDLVCRGIECSSDEGEVVLDLFGGSGTTLIACERLKRKCAMMEFSEVTCDTILTRWESYTGKKATLQRNYNDTDEAHRDQ